MLCGFPGGCCRSRVCCARAAAERREGDLAAASSKICVICGAMSGSVHHDRLQRETFRRAAGDGCWVAMWRMVFAHMHTTRQEEGWLWGVYSVGYFWGCVRVMITTLRGVHAVAGILQLGSALAFVGLYFGNGSPDATASVYTHYTSWEPVGNETDCYEFKCRTVDASHAYSVDMLALVIFFTAWSGLCHFMTSWKCDEKVDVCRFFRAADYAVSAPVMLIVVCITCGVSDLGQISVSAGLMSLIVVVDFMADWFADEQHSPIFYEQKNTRKMVGPGGTVANNFQRKIVLVTLVPYVLMWGMIWLSFGLAAGGGLTKAPDFVFVIVGATMFTFSSFAILRVYTLWWSVGNEKRTEALYAVLSLTAKVQLSWLFFVGVLQDMTIEGGGKEVRAEGEELETALAVFGGTVGAGILLGVAVWRTNYA